jgi:hypothetical protein
MRAYGRSMVAALLVMLAMLMGGHLLLLHTGLRECDEFHRTLVDRLAKTPVGSEAARALIKDWQAYLDGQQSECAQQEETYSDAADKYIAVIISLLSGAGMLLGHPGDGKPPHAP